MNILSHINLTYQNAKGTCIQLSYDTSENYLKIDVNGKQLLSCLLSFIEVHFILLYLKFIFDIFVCLQITHT